MFFFNWHNKLSVDNTERERQRNKSHKSGAKSYLLTLKIKKNERTNKQTQTN